MRVFSRLWARPTLPVQSPFDCGRLGRWTSADLAEYLLDYFPRKVGVDAETLDAVPECMQAFLAFMQARGSLSGEPLEVLEQALDVLGEEFKTHAQDSSRWGLAKSMFMRMQTEGVDPSQPGAIDAWIDDFNSREERDAIIGPAADRMAQAAGGASKPRAQRRRAQKAARKRKRRVRSDADCEFGRRSGSATVPPCFCAISPAAPATTPRVLLTRGEAAAVRTIRQRPGAERCLCRRESSAAQPGRRSTCSSREGRAADAGQRRPTSALPLLRVTCGRRTARSAGLTAWNSIR
jgi:hypothetical protein